MTVLATAGHVDHGKSTLVNFLTGQETDRLAEEKQRGLTINLGFTHFEYKEKVFSIVDVPGHSDYFKNTVSGFSNVDGILFCVDITQGWSQQSEDHFLSLINLGINNVLFFLTKIDKSETSINKGFLKDKLNNYKDLNFKIVEFSSLNSDHLSIKKTIYNFFSKTENQKNPASMWIDRVFTIDGIGKIVTGTASKDMQFEKVYVNGQHSELEIKELQTIGKKINTSNLYSSRVAISLKKNNKSDPKKGSLLSNFVSLPADYIFFKPKISYEKFDSRGTLRVYVGTHNQIINKFKTVQINGQTVYVVQLNKSISLLNFQKILLHNLSKNTFFGGDVVFATENTYLIKNLLKNYKKNQNIISEEFFSLVPGSFISNVSDYKKIGDFYISNEKLISLEEHIKSNFNEINKDGVKEYFYKKLFINYSEIDHLFENFSLFKLNQNQIIVNNTLNINQEVLKEIKVSLGNKLSVNTIEFRNYKKEDVKALFMNSYLYRVSDNLVISREHKEELIKIIHTLPEEFSITNFKEASKLSRKYTIPFLEFLDREAITKKINSDGVRRKIL
jgi:selenocysteine-specific elongation factor